MTNDNRSRPGERTASILPWPARERLRLASTQGTPGSVERSAAVAAAVAWCRRHYPQHFRDSEA